MPRGRARHQTWASDQLRVLEKLYEGHDNSPLLEMSSWTDRQQKAIDSSSRKYPPPTIVLED